LPTLLMRAERSLNSYFGSELSNPLPGPLPSDFFLLEVIPFHFHPNLSLTVSLAGSRKVRQQGPIRLSTYRSFPVVGLGAEPNYSLPPHILPVSLVGPFHPPAVWRLVTVLEAPPLSVSPFLLSFTGHQAGSFLVPQAAFFRVFSSLFILFWSEPLRCSRRQSLYSR